MNSRDVRTRANNQLMFGKIGLSLLLAIAVLVAPAAPIEIAKISSPDAICSTMHMNMDPCQRCPLSSNQTSSNSTCCSVQAPCFVGYANSSEDFVAGVSRNDFTTSANDRVSARFQRPPVPPPRVAFS
jgi:hypothetical protein